MAGLHAIFLQTGLLRLQPPRVDRSSDGASPSRRGQFFFPARSQLSAMPPARWLEWFRAGAPTIVVRRRSPRRYVRAQDQDPKLDSSHMQFIVLQAEF